MSQTTSLFMKKHDHIKQDILANWMIQDSNKSWHKYTYAMSQIKSLKRWTIWSDWVRQANGVLGNYATSSRTQGSLYT